MIQVFPDYDALSRATSEFIFQQAQSAIQRQGRFSLVLSGGRTPHRTYEMLAQGSSAKKFPWDNVHLFWGDERCVPENDPRRNECMARATFIDHVPIPAKNVHPVPYRPFPQKSAESYELVLKSYFAGRRPSFDLILLGLGEDGHTASLFPGSSVLLESEQWVAAVHSERTPLIRISMTLPLINQARKILFLVSGKSKSRILHEIWNDSSNQHHLPAGSIQPLNGELIWFADEAAAREGDIPGKDE